MVYRKQLLSWDPARLAHLSEKLVTDHYEHHYVPAVERLNHVLARLEEMDFERVPAYLLASAPVSRRMSTPSWRTSTGRTWHVCTRRHPPVRVLINPHLRRAKMKWVTRERPKIDRIACPWLIARFIDRDPSFLYVPAPDVLRVAEEAGAVPYDIPGAELGHHGEYCSFDAFMQKYGLDDPALVQLARIVRGADTSRLDLTPQSPGLYAISQGLSRNFQDDHEMLRHGMVMYDALYAWCREQQVETQRQSLSR